MKKIIAALMALSLAGCSEFFPGDGRFYVRYVQEGKTNTNYQVVPLGSGGIGATWFVAGRGQYHIGDTLIIGIVRR